MKINRRDFLSRSRVATLESSLTDPTSRQALESVGEPGVWSDWYVLDTVLPAIRLGEYYVTVDCAPAFWADHASRGSRNEVILAVGFSTRPRRSGRPDDFVADVVIWMNRDWRTFRQLNRNLLSLDLFTRPDRLALPPQAGGGSLPVEPFRGVRMKFRGSLPGTVQIDFGPEAVDVPTNFRIRQYTPESDADLQRYKKRGGTFQGSTVTA